MRVAQNVGKAVHQGTQPGGNPNAFEPKPGAGSQEAEQKRFTSSGSEPTRNNIVTDGSPKAGHRLTTQAEARIII